jgi:hypothetical protein
MQMLGSDVNVSNDVIFASALNGSDTFQFCKEMSYLTPYLTSSPPLLEIENSSISGT